MKYNVNVHFIILVVSCMSRCIDCTSDQPSFLFQLRILTLLKYIEFYANGPNVPYVNKKTKNLNFAIMKFIGLCNPQNGVT